MASAHFFFDLLLIVFAKYYWNKLGYLNLNVYTMYKGGQWLSGRVLDSRPKGPGFEHHLRHCIVSLSKNINPSLVLDQPRKTLPYTTERVLLGRKESNQRNTVYRSS